MVKISEFQHYYKGHKLFFTDQRQKLDLTQQQQQQQQQERDLMRHSFWSKVRKGIYTIGTFWTHLFTIGKKSPIT